jgi:hypothetical protein
MRLMDIVNSIVTLPYEYGKPDTLNEEVGLNFNWIYKKVNKDKKKFFDFLANERKKFGEDYYSDMLNYTLRDYKENPSKYKTIKDKEEKLWQMASAGKIYPGDESLNEVKYSLTSAYLGNGLTYWNAEEEDEAGDYKRIAHIDKAGKLTIYDNSIPSDIKKFLAIQANAMKKGVRPSTF